MMSKQLRAIEYDYQTGKVYEIVLEKTETTEEFIIYKKTKRCLKNLTLSTTAKGK
jgi:hypothetical protein